MGPCFDASCARILGRVCGKLDGGHEVSTRARLRDALLHHSGGNIAQCPLLVKDEHQHANQSRLSLRALALGACRSQRQSISSKCPAEFSVVCISRSRPRPVSPSRRPCWNWIQANVNLSSSSFMEPRSAYIIARVTGKPSSVWRPVGETGVQ